MGQLLDQEATAPMASRVLRNLCPRRFGAFIDLLTVPPERFGTFPDLRLTRRRLCGPGPATSVGLELAEANAPSSRSEESSSRADAKPNDGHNHIRRNAHRLNDSSETAGRPTHASTRARSAANAAGAKLFDTKLCGEVQISSIECNTEEVPLLP